MSINAEYINPFLEAASVVFKSILNVDLRRGKLVIKENPIPSMDIAIIIGITGGVTGEVVYSMSFPMVEKIAQVLVPGLSPEQIQHEYKDIIGELANMITGNAMNLFASTGKTIDMTTPTVVEGKDFKITMIKQTTLGITLYSPMGQLEMNIALK
ncbi:MAG TPA: chemotaxis protein CheX [Spirochaetota bacterium]|jgi:chemotaxis protein CheX|nr:chemotaxis protein CheX [Spirochaetota bacterium]OQA96324.1 MAG: CheY-P phosphatase CheX [Spirochaetes bacterium ADurb.Bin218]HOK03105.1 chemotaxis protein CheX [Spirochaetota bacterium]HOK93114.1 chemotaxis protein CheX [Spirochaetota bacterium]HON16180.1 chemotaxis protein CheX [Spirochaetota bacterium]